MHGSKLNKVATSSFAKSFSSKIINPFFAKNERIYGQQILTLSPVVQVNFFILKILFDQWKEETKKFNSPYFDYQNEKVRQALNMLVNTLSKNISIQKEDFIPLMTQAVENTLQYYYNPSVYLQGMLEADPSPHKANVLQGNSKYLKLHRPVVEQVMTKWNENSTDDLGQIVATVTSNFVPSLAEIAEIKNQFNAVTPFDVLESEELPTPKPPVVPMLKNTPKPTVAQASKTHNQVEENPKPIAKRLSTPDSINEKYKEKAQTLNQQYNSREREKTVATIHEAQSTSNLKNSININQHYLFVSDLFDDNEQMYENALDEVEQTGSFDASVELLVQRYSKKYQWDMNSNEVKELLKVIFKRFR